MNPGDVYEHWGTKERVRFLQWFQVADGTRVPDFELSNGSLSAGHIMPEDIRRDYILVGHTFRN